jgi:hypothetical protein
MRQTTLRTVSLHTVANYRQAAEHTVAAYRASGHRLLALMSRDFERSSKRAAPDWMDTLRRANTLLSEAAVKGIDKVSAQTERVIEFGSDRVSARIERIADMVEGIENRYVATGLHAAARVSLRGAQTALTLSEKLAAGADLLATAVGGKQTRGTAGRGTRQDRRQGRTPRRCAGQAQGEQGGAGWWPSAPRPSPRKQAAQPVAEAKPKVRTVRRAAPKAEQAVAPQS